MEEIYTLVAKGPHADVYESKTTYKKIYNKLEKKLDEDAIIKICNITKELGEKIPQYVPKILSITQEPENTTIVMEKVEGITMRKFLEEKEKYSLDEIEKVISSLSKAISKLHDVGYIHGDLHEGNIIIRKNLSIVFIDFDNVDNYSEENLEDSGDNDYLKYYIARLLFTFEKETLFSVNKVLKASRKKEVKDIINHETNPEVALGLYKLFTTY